MDEGETTEKMVSFDFTNYETPVTMFISLHIDCLYRGSLLFTGVQRTGEASE